MLRREPGDASKARHLFASDVRALDGALQQHKLEPVPAVSKRERADEPEHLAIQCLSTRGRDCKGDAAAERD
ncbi:hypothetical protein BH11MYX1_BH11MYX1_50310 [soil metagenome]